MSDRRVRVSRAVISHLEGTHAWQVPQDDDWCGGAAVSLMSKVKGAPSHHRDGACMVILTDAEQDALYEYAQVMAIRSRDNIKPPGQVDGPNWPLGEYNAANALMRQLTKLRKLRSR